MTAGDAPFGYWYLLSDHLTGCAAGGATASSTSFLYPSTVIRPSLIT
jgi:hypothetical protein